MAIYQLGQPGNVILQAAAQVQMLPIVSRTVRDFMHEGVNTENKCHPIGKDTGKSTTEEETFQNKPPPRFPHSKQKVLSTAGSRKPQANIQESEYLMKVENVRATLFCCNHKKTSDRSYIGLM